MIKPCQTCGHYRRPNERFECHYWEQCVPEGICDKWFEGSNPVNLLARIHIIETMLGVDYKPKTFHRLTKEEQDEMANRVRDKIMAIMEAP